MLHTLQYVMLYWNKYFTVSDTKMNSKQKKISNMYTTFPLIKPLNSELGQFHYI